MADSDKRNKYFWHGEPVKAEFGYAHIFRNEEKPLFWYNYECRDSPTLGALVSCIRVTPENGTPFFIANHFGIGAHKLKRGGWPNLPHYGIPEDSKFENDSVGFEFGARELDLDAYEEHEANRKEWQRLMYPEDYKRVQALRDKIKIYKS